MGWIEIEYVPRKDFARYMRTVVAVNLKGIYDIVRFEEDVQMGNVQVFYLAIRKPTIDNSADITAAVLLTEREGKRLRYNFMHETEEPLYYRASQDLLDKLSPIESRYANNWREKCRKQIERNIKIHKIAATLDNN